MIFKSKGNSFDYLVAFLGNPGKEYENTRHNAGFMAADRLYEKYPAKSEKKRFDSLYGDVQIKDKRILVLKPQTFMNLSGKAVLAAASFYKIPTDKIIVVFDDISLDVGKIRIRRKGSDGGHNGMKNIINLLGSNEIMRIKVGVGQKPNPEYDLKDFVLSRLPKEEMGAVDTALDNTVKAIEEILSRGIDSAMNKFSK